MELIFRPERNVAKRSAVERYHLQKRFDFGLREKRSSLHSAREEEQK